MRTLIKQVPPGLMAAVLFTLLFLFAGLANGQSNVVIKGTLYASADSDAQPYAELVAASGEHMRVLIRPNGTFWVEAPAGDTYLLRFSQPGSLTKEVTVDATATGYKLRRISFDVVLH
ncbi:MAG TPA: hypothetical protein VHL57_07970, partial [Flavobacteriales bacterium]|nr:hypothetical protein [Flavobacteriales bacterium]